MTKNKPTQKTNDLISIGKASEMLGCHPNTLRQWDEKGILKAIRFGQRKDRRYKKSDIIKLLSQTN
jgi:excisionase family DNA binding protein